MKCPYCGFAESKVVDSRPNDNSIRRRRECLSCLRRFTTYELVERAPIVVVKRDGARQAFDRVKLTNSMVRACDRRQVPLSALENAAVAIEAELQTYADREIPTSKVGELAMRKLRDLDEVAYVRFASVYRQFKDIGSFMEELTRLMNEK